MAAVMNRSHSSILTATLSNEHTHLSKQIRNNAIAIASTRQKKKQTMASVPPSASCCNSPRRTLLN
eukprot:scaffold6422_cov69-Cyclotella_meneghiniana.AAC.5